MNAQRLSVEIELAPLANTFELQKYFVVLLACRNNEVFSVPCHSCGKIVDIHPEGLLLIESMGQGDVLPFLIIEFRAFCALEISCADFPSGIEVDQGALVAFLTQSGLCRHKKEQENCGQNEFHIGIYGVPFANIEVLFF